MQEELYTENLVVGPLVSYKKKKKNPACFGILHCGEKKW